MKPSQSRALHVKRSDGKTFVVRCGVILKKLDDLKDSTQGVRTVKTGNIQLHAMRVGRKGYKMWVCRIRGRRMLTGFEMSHFMKKFINFGGHCVLSGGEGEFCYDLFDAVHIGLGISRLNHGVQ